MHRLFAIRAALVLAGGVAALGSSRHVATQGSELATSRVYHVGVVVPNIDAALREYALVMGFRTPKADLRQIQQSSGGTVDARLATLYLPNFVIEVFEPVSRTGPYYEHLRAHGPGIQHVGLALPGSGSVDDLRAAWERQGGRWTIGPKGAHYAYLNFQSSLGTTLELNRGGTTSPAEPPLPPPAPDTLPRLAALNVTHVGFAASDTAAVTATFAKVLGISAPRVNEYKDSQYPPNSKWNASAYLRLASWNQGGIGLEFIESVGGPTPWSEFVKQQKGTAAQHIAINVGSKMDEMIADLQKKGGKWTNGKSGGGYAYLDFQDTLGLVFELNGTSKSAPAK